MNLFSIQCELTVPVHDISDYTNAKLYEYINEINKSMSRIHKQYLQMNNLHLQLYSKLLICKIEIILLNLQIQNLKSLIDMSEDNIAFRLKFLLQKLGLTSSSFADQCGISRATFSQLLTGRNKKISDVLIGQIHTAFPSVSVLWLLFNEGPMFIGQPEGQEFRATDSQDTEDLDSKGTATGEGSSGGNTIERSKLPNDNHASNADIFMGGSSKSDNSQGHHLPDNSNVGIDRNSGAKFPSENPEFLRGGRAAFVNSKENGLNSCIKDPNNTDLNSVNGQQNSPEFINEIEFLRPKSRKVVQVTIYYDDSTFETLFPR